MKKLRTVSEILTDRTIFTEEQQNRIEENAIKEAQKIWGDKRAGAGKKQKANIRLTVSAKHIEL